MLKITLLFTLISIQLFSQECITNVKHFDPILHIDMRIKHSNEQLQMCEIDDYYALDHFDYAYYYYYLGKLDAYEECQELINYAYFDTTQRALVDN